MVSGGIPSRLHLQDGVPAVVACTVCGWGRGNVRWEEKRWERAQERECVCVRVRDGGTWGMEYKYVVACARCISESAESAPCCWSCQFFSRKYGGCALVGHPGDDAAAQEKSIRPAGWLGGSAKGMQSCSARMPQPRRMAQWKKRGCARAREREGEKARGRDAVARVNGAWRRC